MNRPRHQRAYWIFTAIVVMLQLLVVQAMASSGALHKHLHDHADEPSHECAVTLIQNGGYATVVPDCMTVAYTPEPSVEPQLLLATPVAVRSHLIGGVLAHAPPRGP